MRRFVDEEELLRRLFRPPRGGGNGMSAKALESLKRWLRKQPPAPHLVSRSRAAEMLGTPSSYVSRLIEQGRMPEAIEVEGSAPVYIFEEVEALAREFNAERAKRRRRRRERSAV